MRHLLAILCTLCLANATPAVVVIDIEEVGSDVVASGSGTLNTTDLSALPPQGTLDARTFPTEAMLVIGSPFIYSSYTGISGPSSIGTGSVKTADTGNGDGVFGPHGSINSLLVPMSYTSGSPLAGSATWNNTDLETLGITEGTYTWTWGSGANADSLTVNVGAVPEPSTYAALAGLAALGLAFFRKRRR